jgi:hypothetical protein
MEEKNSGYGLASIGLSSLSALALFITTIVAGIMQSVPGGMDPESGGAMAVGLAIFFFIFLSLIGGALGIVGLLQKDRKKVLAVLGICLSVVTVLCIVGLIIIGLAMGG